MHTLMRAARPFLSLKHRPLLRYITMATPSASENAELPKLSPAEFREYNKLAEMMDYYVRFYGLAAPYQLTSGSTIISAKVGP
jgi:hypothetical protein